MYIVSITIWITMFVMQNISNAFQTGSKQPIPILLQISYFRGQTLVIIQTILTRVLAETLESYFIYPQSKPLIASPVLM